MGIIWDTTEAQRVIDRADVRRHGRQTVSTLAHRAGSPEVVGRGLAQAFGGLIEKAAGIANGELVDANDTTTSDLPGGPMRFDKEFATTAEAARQFMRWVRGEGQDTGPPPDNRQPAVVVQTKGGKWEVYPVRTGGVVTRWNDGPFRHHAASDQMPPGLPQLAFSNVDFASVAVAQGFASRQQRGVVV